MQIHKLQLQGNKVAADYYYNCHAKILTEVLIFCIFIKFTHAYQIIKFVHITISIGRNIPGFRYFKSSSKLLKFLFIALKSI